MVRIEMKGLCIQKLAGGFSFCEVEQKRSNPVRAVVQIDPNRIACERSLLEEIVRNAVVRRDFEPRTFLEAWCGGVVSERGEQHNKD
jgi:hypothetical protein